MTANAVQNVTLKIDGMHCGSCIRRVTQAIQGASQGTGPVTVKEVRLGAARFEAPESDPEATGAVVAALAKAGFTAHVED